MSPHPNPSVELIFLGTGTSSGLPSIACLTQPLDEKTRGCRACLSTLKPEGKHNIRRNTSAVLRMKGKKGQTLTIVIDAGKTFQASALEWFPKYGLRRIDALLLTHAHADAVNGLDDLREWTLRGSIQTYIDVYLSQETFQQVKRSFPYLVSKEFASGGGDVPDFVWHIIDDGVPFEINDTGVFVTPFSVQHGRIFSTACSAYIPGTPNEFLAADVKPAEMLEKMNMNGLESPKPANLTFTKEIIQPYLSFGFKFQEHLVYISDVSHIPESARSIIRGERDGKRPRVCVLDCLRLKRHTSHFGLDQSVAAARELGALRSYFVGFSDRVSHEEYVTITEVLGGITHAEEELSVKEKIGIGLLGEGEKIWARPAHDGLRVLINSELGLVRDDTYDK
ncbi:hypothetical protein E1B28_002332 [Marasmius oreades]|uniref:Metallo-beta-lactamase domain-containing protein n=1 Tax=Marasmius oreades TaxID=181124 RepID=A0A9P7UKH6_9AGAR|nr:uncharacterized protein E1B28_002332 [Marasmius oreades]KAG7086372.1 hypothetical protein E1B28_002332 [Marasmius oreades]